MKTALTGYYRSVQVATPADGRCGIWALCAQLPECLPGGSYGEPDLELVELVRERTVREVPFLIERGEMVWDDSRGNTLTVLEWQKKMCQSLEWVDTIFMIAFAKIHQGDIVILPTFPRSGWLGDGSLRCLRGGPRVFPIELSRICREGVDSPATGVPFLLGVQEGGIFCNEHFQVLIL